MKFIIKIHTVGNKELFTDDCIDLNVPELETREQVRLYCIEYIKKLNENKTADHPGYRLAGIEKIRRSVFK